jgi:anti-sigma B factor antagonist
MVERVEVRYQALGKCLIVRVAGEVDSSGARILRDSLVGKVSTGDARLVVDLTRVPAMDVTGTSALLAAQQEAEASGGSLRLVGLGPTLRTVVQAADKLGALMIDDDMSDALEASMQPALRAEPTQRRQVPRQAGGADVNGSRFESRRG